MGRTDQDNSARTGRRGGSLRAGLVLAGALLAGAALGTGGCNGKTETGYEPHKLGMSDAARRALYAPAFTAEARAADSEKSELKSRQPGGGAGGGPPF